ncbi:MAG: hypothetical protein WDN48_11290 [Pseudolabrys sp.]
MPARDRALWALAVIAALTILIAPAIWNHFPLLQHDTGGYLARWYEGTLVPSRAVVYGLILNLGVPAGVLAGAARTSRADGVDRGAAAARARSRATARTDARDHRGAVGVDHPAPGSRRSCLPTSSAVSASSRSISWCCAATPSVGRSASA